MDRLDLHMGNLFDRHGTILAFVIAFLESMFLTGVFLGLIYLCWRLGWALLK